VYIATLKRGVFICLLTSLAAVGDMRAQDTNPIAYWNFDSIQGSKALDSVSGIQDAISSNHRLVRGVKGQAIVMDGYSTCITRSPAKVPEFGQTFTIEAWIALGAYPWNRAPIVSRENTVSMNSNLDSVCRPDDIKVNSPTEGFFFGISPQGYLGFHAGAGGRKSCHSGNKIPLRKWTHVAATFDKKAGVIEHMLDPRCRFSHVRIIENTPARVVVHWRYCPISANGNHSQVNPISGWEDWVDEYYTFHADQVGLRKVVFHSDGEPLLHPDAIIPFCQPGQRPEDVIDLSAMTLANLNGKQHTYSWKDKSPKIRTAGRWERGSYIHFGDDLGEKPNTMIVNLKKD